ncbi:MAG: hypothetical protein FWD82_08455 [Defluviitaleaceae bacterium]|nr:hypothetical protein [Defluviitaleaceae bacterium]
MKSPYKISQEIGVSPQAVYKKLTNEFINKFNNHMQRKEKGKYLLDEVAEKALKELFNQIVQPVQQENIEQIQQPLLNQLNSENMFLKARIEMLEQELKTERAHGRTQADKLSDLATRISELTHNNQILLGAEQSKSSPMLLLDGETTIVEKIPLKQILLQKIFGKS